MTEPCQEYEPFPALWAAHQSSLLVYILAAVPKYQDAQDLLQQVAVVAFRKQESFDPNTMEFAGWIRAIARWEILRYRRDLARDRLVFDEATLEHLALAQNALGPEIEARAAFLLNCIKKLKGRAGRIVELRYAQGLMPQEIAQQLSTSANAINVALVKARQRLRACIERQLGAARARQ